MNERSMAGALAALVILLLAVLASGCGEMPERDRPTEVEVAFLRNFEQTQGGLLFGWAGGRADLVVRDRNGLQYVYPVRFRGPVVGVFAGASRTMSIREDWPFDLDEAERPLTVNDLFGRYRGSTGSAVVGLGYTGTRLENEVGVVLDPKALSAGLQLGFAFESLTIGSRN